MPKRSALADDSSSGPGPGAKIRCHTAAVTATAVASPQKTSSVVASIQSMHAEVMKVMDLNDDERASYDAIKKLHTKITHGDCKISTSLRTKLRNEYEDLVLNLTDSVEAMTSCLSHCSDAISKMEYNSNETRSILSSSRRSILMNTLQRRAVALSLYIPASLTEVVSPLVGAIPAESFQYAEKGDLVAAKVTVNDNPPEENWILAECLGYNYSTQKYEVKDIDAEEDDKQQSHFLARRRVIQLPKFKANPFSTPEALFEQDQFVLALLVCKKFKAKYPQTTCFYKGMVKETPHTPLDPYQISFEDVNYTDGFSPPFPIHQYYVLRFK